MSRIRRWLRGEESLLSCTILSALQDVRDLASHTRLQRKPPSVSLHGILIETYFFPFPQSNARHKMCGRGGLRVCTPTPKPKGSIGNETKCEKAIATVTNGPSHESCQVVSWIVAQHSVSALRLLFLFLLRLLPWMLQAYVPLLREQSASQIFAVKATRTY